MPLQVVNNKLLVKKTKLVVVQEGDCCCQRCPACCGLNTIKFIWSYGAYPFNPAAREIHFYSDAECTIAEETVYATYILSVIEVSGVPQVTFEIYCGPTLYDVTLTKLSGNITWQAVSSPYGIVWRPSGQARYRFVDSLVTSGLGVVDTHCCVDLTFNPTELQEYSSNPGSVTADFMRGCETPSSSSSSSSSSSAAADPCATSNCNYIWLGDSWYSFGCSAPCDCPPEPPEPGPEDPTYVLYPCVTATSLPLREMEPESWNPLP